ncbi:MAG: pyridoxamine 5'-phosphate oxidase family protein [Pandoraea sp.]|nr:MAG: pyridoxamine 5'-phosphate oxidase family protein [Pandoraea sp.]TAM15731.1 MAG: pyridoxamine 5'-phosphate oxidase family protein [Pandoraea sp.]
MPARAGRRIWISAENRTQNTPEHCFALRDEALFNSLLGHSAFNHSYNYRSVVVQGRCEVVNDPEQKKFAMRAFVDHVVAGRWETLRPVTDSEMRAVVVMRIRLSTVSAKARDEFPDKETDNPDWPVWVGVIPARLAFGAPEADPVRNKVSPAPEQVREYAGIDRFTPTYRFKTNSPADEGD